VRANVRVYLYVCACMYVCVYVHYTYMHVYKYFRLGFDSLNELKCDSNYLANELSRIQTHK